MRFYPGGSEGIQATCSGKNIVQRLEKQGDSKDPCQSYPSYPDLRYWNVMYACGQTALDLRDAGKEVHVIAECTGSRKEEKLPCLGLGENAADKCCDKLHRKWAAFELMQTALFKNIQETGARELVQNEE